MLAEELQTAGSLCSADITPLHRSYGPLRHPLLFSRLPGFAGYTAYLVPAFSRRKEEGFSSCFARPCHRAAATTPPEWRVVSASLRLSMLPSSTDRRLGLRILGFRGHLCVRLRCGPVTRGHPCDDPVDGLQVIGFPPPCHPSYKASGFCLGGTVSRGTRQP
jgi:hypothetical protein